MILLLNDPYSYSVLFGSFHYHTVEFHTLTKTHYFGANTSETAIRNYYLG